MRQQIAAADEMLGRYVPVLDHGFVALQDYMGGDEAIERAARQSYQSETRGIRERRDLLRYLFRKRHTSPFEMTQCVFHMALPIYVARQFVRHRTASLNEMSGRYTELPMVFHTPETIRTQSTTNKQGSGGVLPDKNDAKYVQRRMREVRNEAVSHYHELLEMGVAKEQARIDLPLSTYTIWTMRFDLHNLMHFLTLRTDSHAQSEAQSYANVMASLARLVAPESLQAWVDYQVCAETFTMAELKRLKTLLYPNASVMGRIPETTAREAREFDEKIASLMAEKDYAFIPRDVLVSSSRNFEEAMRPFTEAEKAVAT